MSSSTCKWMLCSTIIPLNKVVISGDLVRVELCVWLTTSFDPFFAKGFWEGKKDSMRMLVWISGISPTLPVAAVFSRHNGRSRENETNSTLYRQNRLPCYSCFS